MDSTSNSIVYYIGGEKELHFSVGQGITVSLELLEGVAEIFGSELVPNKVYTFPPYSSVPVFTWKGCTVKLRGRIGKTCVLSDTLMMIPVTIHACLEEMRILACSKKAKGPISLVVGPMQSGKSSFCRLLLNYAARLGRKPLYVDLDVGHNSCFIPGVITILPLEGSSDIIEGFNKQAFTVFNFGYVHPSKNMTLYYLLIKKLGDMLQTSLRCMNQNIHNSGAIIDTCGYIRGKGYTALTLAAYSFQIDVLFVIEDEKLYKYLKIDMPSSVQTVFVPKQLGIIEQSSSLRKDIQANRVWEFFYGTHQTPLYPYQFDVEFTDIEIYKAVVLTANLKNVCNISLDDVRLVRVPIEPELVNQVLGLSFANTVDANLIVTCLKTFVCIVDIDMRREVATVLSPQPGPLPSKILIMGDIKLRRINDTQDYTEK